MRFIFQFTLATLFGLSLGGFPSAAAAVPTIDAMAATSQSDRDKAREERIKAEYELRKEREKAEQERRKEREKAQYELQKERDKAEYEHRKERQKYELERAKERDKARQERQGSRWGTRDDDDDDNDRDDDDNDRDDDDEEDDDDNERGVFNRSTSDNDRAVERGTRIFRTMDRNNDGVISRREWEGTSGSFTRYDRNRDGVLSRRELGAQVPARLPR